MHLRAHRHHAVLAGWTLDIEVLKSVIPGFTTMKPNTALCFLACGFALWILGRGCGGALIGKLCAAFVVVVAAIAGLTIRVQPSDGTRASTKCCSTTPSTPPTFLT